MVGTAEVSEGAMEIDEPASTEPQQESLDTTERGPKPWSVSGALR